MGSCCVNPELSKYGCWPFGCFACTEEPRGTRDENHGYPTIGLIGPLLAARRHRRSDRAQEAREHRFVAGRSDSRDAALRHRALRELFFARQLFLEAPKKAKDRFHPLFARELGQSLPARKLSEEPLLSPRQ